MISINENLDQFRKGVYDTCRLFKTMFQNDRNIILSKDNVNYINNIGRLLDLKTNNNSSYNFGVNFTLTQIQNFRENICINPILYILSLELLLEKITDLRQLEKYDFKKLSDSLSWYYKESSLPRAIITKDCIKRLFVKESQDDFLNKVIDEAYNPSNVEIIEFKYNSIVKHKYYKIKARFINGQIYGENYKIFIIDVLTKELFTKLVNLAVPILIICSETNFEITNTYLLSIYIVSKTEIIKHYTDICLLTGFGKGFQNLNIEEFNNYSFGSVKEFKFDGTLMFSSEVYYTAHELEKMGIKDKYSFYALQGKNLNIFCTEEYLEKVRSLVSTIKALQNNGIFYTEVKTLRIMGKLYSSLDNILYDFLNKLLKRYLELFNFDSNVIEEIINNQNLQSSFDVRSAKYDNDIFTSLDYYLNVFDLLDGNVKVLSKLA